MRENKGVCESVRELKNERGIMEPEIENRHKNKNEKNKEIK